MKIKKIIACVFLSSLILITKQLKPAQEPAAGEKMVKIIFDKTNFEVSINTINKFKLYKFEKNFYKNQKKLNNIKQNNAEAHDQEDFSWNITYLVQSALPEKTTKSQCKILERMLGIASTENVSQEDRNIKMEIIRVAEILLNFSMKNHLSKQFVGGSIH